jgi:hypothetical protein
VPRNKCRWGRPAILGNAALSQPPVILAEDSAPASRGAFHRCATFTMLPGLLPGHGSRRHEGYGATGSAGASPSQPCLANAQQIESRLSRSFAGEFGPPSASAPGRCATFESSARAVSGAQRSPSKRIVRARSGAQHDLHCATSQGLRPLHCMAASSSCAVRAPRPAKPTCKVAWNRYICQLKSGARWGGWGRKTNSEDQRLGKEVWPSRRSGPGRPRS